jgi:hypothetical protein
MTRRWSDWAAAGAVAVLAVGCAAGLYRVLAIIALKVPLDPNEGWNAYHAVAAMTSGSPYPPASSFLTNNYPPLSFYVVGELGRVLDDMIVAGRIVSLLSFLAIAAGIFVALRLMTCAVIEAAFGALVFAACLLLNSDYVGMDDPQLFGHAVAMGGLLLVLAEPRQIGRLIFAALLFTLAFFIKHNLVVLPAVTVVWLAIVDRRSAIWLTASGVVCLALGLIAFRLGYGFGLIGQVQSARLFSAHDLFSNLSSWLIWGLLPLIATAALFMFRRGDKFVLFATIYAAISFFVGASYFGGAGVDVNAMLDADIALALVAGLAMSRFRGDPALLATTLAAFLLPLAINLYLAASADWLTKDFWLHPMRDETALAAEDISFLRAHPGPAICETPGYCYWAGKPAIVDVFNTGQQFATHMRKGSALVCLIEARQFSALQFDTLSPFALGVSVRKAVAQNYRVDHQNDDGVFMVPR